MIDVWAIVANGLWVAGAAVVLATFSWAHWAASQEEERFRDVLLRPWVQRMWGLGLALFFGGMAATSDVWWARALSGVVALIWALHALLAGRGGAAR